MQLTKTVELMVGLFVLLGSAALFFLAMQVSNLGAYTGGSGYRLIAQFDNSGGLKVRSAVTVAGVRVGRVRSISFDKESYQSVVEMEIEAQYDTLPIDSSATILTAGLLGEQYLGIEPGGEAEYLKDGDVFDLTQSALVLEELIGQFLFSKAQETPDE